MIELLSPENFKLKEFREKWGKDKSFNRMQTNINMK